jgi:formylglycine-generating enzyme required for sulfatase activity
MFHRMHVGGTVLVLAAWACSAPEPQHAPALRVSKVAAVESGVAANVSPEIPDPLVAPPEVSSAPPSSEPPEDDMVLVSGGSFTMGCGKADRACLEDEKPSHSMGVRAFKIDRLEVTVEQYLRCVRAGVCPPPSDITRYERCVDHGHCPPPTTNGLGICNANDPSRGQHPINCLAGTSGASDYCKWLGKRLPTSTEWERAARGADQRTFPWGFEAPSDRRLCWMRDSTCPVGSFPEGASPYGALDMAGNVGELVRELTPKPAEPDEGVCTLVSPCAFLRVRGGDFTPGTDVRSSARGELNAANVLPMVGFRCVRELK